MKRHVATVAAVLALAMSVGLAEEPIGTAFTYQGQLKQNGTPVNGSANFMFALFDAPVGCCPVGRPVLTSGGHPVVNGLFTIDLDFNWPPGEWIYAGAAYWIDVQVEYPAGSGHWEWLPPRQRLSATPYSSFSTLASAVPWAGILDMPAGFADGIDDVGDGHFWSLEGNADTVPGTNFLGTTDDTALELHVNGMRALRLEPGNYPNVIGGHPSNVVSPGSEGATIAGGASNSIHADHATVGGGVSNEILAGADNSTIAGGAPWDPNNPLDTNNRVYDRWGTIGGGGYNWVGSDDGDPATAPFATVAGGFRNWATGAQSGIAAGGDNRAGASSAFVGGGEGNSVGSIGAAILGGFDNQIGNIAGWATIGGGRNNEATQEYATIPGGQENLAGGEWSFAGGRRAKVRRPEDVGGGDTNGDEGTFVWSDSRQDEFWSTGPNQFLIQAAGGVGVGTNDPKAQLHVVGGMPTVRVEGVAPSGGPIVYVEQTYPTPPNLPVLGGHFKVAGSLAYGVYAETTETSAQGAYAVYGKSSNVNADPSVFGYGGFFISSGTANGAGVYGSHPGKGVHGSATGGAGIGVLGTVAGKNAKGIRGQATDTGNGPCYGGYFTSAGADGVGAYGQATGGTGRGVIGEATGTYGMGVCGMGDIGVKAESTKEGGYALWAEVTATSGTAIYARGGASGGYAGHFIGNVQICDRGSGATVIELGTGLDYAEGFDVTDAQKVKPGMVLVIDSENAGRLAVCTAAYDRKVAGIVAGANGLGSAVKLGCGQFDHDVALAGRVYCFAVAGDEPIEPGDLLTTSDVPGHAMKARDHGRSQGAILGKAMERLEAGQRGQILVLVTLQ